MRGQKLGRGRKSESDGHSKAHQGPVFGVLGFRVKE
jgi:hypothetical protein